jgi:hypothetical protein
LEPREIVRMIGGEDRFGVLPLRHDAFQAKLAGVVEHGLTVIEFQMLVVPDAHAARTDASVALRTASGSRRRSSPFSSIRSKA